MEIIKQTPTKLIIKTSDFWYNAMFSCSLIALGILAIMLLSNNTTLTCQRLGSKQDKCQLTQANLLSSSTLEIPLENLYGAKLVGEEQSTAVLLTKAGEIPFTFYSSSDNKSYIANEINSFVKNANSQSLNVSQDDRWFGWMFGGIFLLAALPVLISAKNEIYIFDKTLGKMTVKQLSLMVNDIYEYSTSEISEVESGLGKDGMGQSCYSVNLSMLSGTKISVTVTSSSREARQKDADLIRSYLDERSPKSITNDK